MTTWIVGDIHGCARELERLLERLELAPRDRLVCVGDLFHRGPDATGVMELLQRVDALFVLGNHEHAALERCGLAPRVGVRERPQSRSNLSELTGEDLAGDGRRALTAAPGRLGELLVFLQGHAGYWLEHDQSPGAGTTLDGRPWCVVHAGRTPGREARDSRLQDLLYPPRTRRGRRTFWFESYTGPKLVIYGHLPNGEPRETRHEGQLTALGLDTGCVYGGRLSAYSPELDRFESVSAERTYAHFS